MDPDPTSFKSLILTVDYSVVLGIVLLFVLLFCSALISGAEVAMFSLTRSDLEKGLESKLKPILIIEKLLERPKKTIGYDISC